MERSFKPEIETQVKRRKVDLEDMRGFLGNTLDQHLAEKSKEMEQKYDEKYKTVVYKQKREIETL